MPRPPDIRTLYAAFAVLIGTFLLGLLFWHASDMDPMWAVVAFILVYDPDSRAAYDSAISRMCYTFLGGGISVCAILLFGLHKWLMPVGVAFTMFICGYFLKFRGAWRALLTCVALVIGASLTDPSGDVRIAVMRGVEVTAGSLLAVGFSLLFVWFSSRTKSGKKDS